MAEAQQKRKDGHSKNCQETLGQRKQTQVKGKRLAAKPAASVVLFCQVSWENGHCGKGSILICVALDVFSVSTGPPQSCSPFPLPHPCPAGRKGRSYPWQRPEKAKQQRRKASGWFFTIPVALDAGGLCSLTPLWYKSVPSPWHWQSCITAGSQSPLVFPLQDIFPVMISKCMDRYVDTYAHTLAYTISLHLGTVRACSYPRKLK